MSAKASAILLVVLVAPLVGVEGCAERYSTECALNAPSCASGDQTLNYNDCDTCACVFGVGWTRSVCCRATQAPSRDPTLGPTREPPLGPTESLTKEPSREPNDCTVIHHALAHRSSSYCMQPRPSSTSRAWIHWLADVCMCVRMYRHVYTHACTHVYRFVHRYVHQHVYRHVCRHCIQTCVGIRVETCVETCAETSVETCVVTSMQACVYACPYTCLHTCV